MIIDIAPVLQSKSYDCGRAVAEMILTYFDRPKPTQLPSSPIDGTDPRTIENWLRGKGLYCISGEMSPSDLQSQLRLGRPVACLTQYGGTGHWVLVRGVARNRVHFNCPVTGAVSVPLPQFVKDWWDQGRDVRYHQFGLSVWEN